MKNKNISDLTDQYNNFIYPNPTENLSEEWIKKNRFQICDPNYCWHRLWPEKPYNTKRLDTEGMIKLLRKLPLYKT